MTTEVHITTFNRLPYLEKCVWSIIATAQKDYIIRVSDDGSTDNTVEWLKMMEKRGLLEPHFNNCLGTAENYNYLMSIAKTEYPIITNDDMYFYRGWDTLDIPEDCGTLTMNDVSGNMTGALYPIVIAKPKHYGNIACTYINKALWGKIPFKFNRPKDKKRLGYFGNSFLEFAKMSRLPKSQHYISKPYFALNMERKTCKLSEYDYLIKIGYIDERKKWQKGHASNYGLPKGY